MEVTCRILLRGRTTEVRWRDGVVTGEPEVLRRLALFRVSDDDGELMTLLHALEDAYGRRPDIEVVHDPDRNAVGPDHRPATVVDLDAHRAKRATRPVTTPSPAGTAPSEPRMPTAGPARTAPQGRRGTDR